jgi:uncharacterized SAM-dependent methyltransferase
LAKLVDNGKKYRNKRAYKEITPSEDFYSLYNSQQIIDIANSLDKYHEVPSHYRYLGKGAVYWNAYLHKLYDAGSNNMLTTTLEMLRLDKGYFEALLSQYDHVNLVDIGVGNGLAAKDLLLYLRDTGKLKRYIGIDCSTGLLDITERNVTEWLSGTVHMEKHVCDITSERFTEILTSDSFNKDASATINIILFLGGTIGNFREPSQALKTIRDSMGKDDILITSDELDSENARKFVGFSVGTDKTVCLRNKLLLNLLSIEDSFFDMEQVFDERVKCRLTQARLKVELCINFEVGSFKKIVKLHKGEIIVLFRMWEWTSQELLSIYEKNGLSQVRTTRLHNPEYVLLVSKVSTDPINAPTET